MTTPDLRIVHGDATPEEVAALVLALAARATPARAPASRKSEPWRDPAHRMRKPLAHGPGAWRSGSMPF
ncbi:acyl-CoA carboxylase epsilon subunit [Streptosporangium sp. KLBMP 9127]|nr:acyl-CoA carboxylase subunit epsilon [Streptosporangium sp. KLBMP 9127]